MLWRIKAILFAKPESKFSRKWAFSIISSIFFFHRVTEKSPFAELSRFLLAGCWGINRVLCAVWIIILSFWQTRTRAHTKYAHHLINTTAAGQVFFPTVKALISEECKSTCFHTAFFFFRRPPLPTPLNKFHADWCTLLTALCRESFIKMTIS